VIFGSIPLSSRLNRSGDASERPAEEKDAKGMSSMGRRESRLLLRAVLWAGVAAAASLSPAGSPAYGFELFGVHLWGERPLTADRPDPENPDAQTYTIDLDIRSPVAERQKDVAETVRGASRLWGEQKQKPPAGAPAFLSILRGETGRIVAALRGEAFYGAAVAITVAGRPLESLAPDEALPHPAAVVVRVDSGPPFSFGKIIITGRPPDPADPLSPRRDTPEKLGLVSGRPARAAVIPAAEQALLEGWRRHGHALPRLQPRDVVARHETAELDVTLAADPGPATRFGPVTVSGVERMDPAFVADIADLPHGAPWDQAVVEQAQRRLRNLQVFSSVRIQPDRQPAADGALSATIQAAERPLRVFEFDASHSTLDGIGVGGAWRHRNLFAHAEQLKLEARVNGVRSADPKDFTYAAGATLVQPGLFAPTAGLTSQFFAKREAPETYIQTSVQARSGVVWEVTPALIVGGMINAELDDVTDAYGKRSLALFSLPLSLEYDGADDKLSPTTGVRVKLSAEPFIETRFGNIGVIGKAGVADYLALDGARRTVLATRLQVGGVIGGATSGQLPPDRLFFAGGGQSVRGYSYRSLGPKRADGTVVGGRSTLEASVELRVKVTDTIGVVPFVDAGGAYAGSLPDFAEPLKIGAGIGVRYFTGLGPVRADIAVPVGGGGSSGGVALYLGLGESF
jgi:translocation and assembly module TamA